MEKIYFSTLFLLILALAMSSNSTRAEAPTEGGPLLHTVQMRDGHPVDPNDPMFHPVVAIVRHSRKYDEKTKTFTEVDNLCSGTVINVSCVLTASHCLPGPNEEVLSTKIYRGGQLLGSIPVASSHKWFARTDDNKVMKNDLGLMKIDPAQPELFSVFTSQLHDADNNSLLQDAPLKLAGYGAYTSHPDPQTGEPIYENAGILRSGTLHVTQNVPNKGEAIEAVPGTDNQSAGPGDSGGPAMAEVNGKPMIYGVIGSINDAHLPHTTKNFLTPIHPHMDWLRKTMKELECTEEDAHKQILQTMLAQKFVNPAEEIPRLIPNNQDDPKKLYEELQTKLKEAIDLSSLPGGDKYRGIRITKVLVQGNGDIDLDWEGSIVENPTSDRLNIALDDDAARREPKVGRRVAKKLTLKAPPRQSRDRLQEPLLRIPKFAYQ